MTAFQIQTFIPRDGNFFITLPEHLRGADVELFISKKQREEPRKMSKEELLGANKTLESLGLSDDKMNELLNTDSTITTLRKKVDEAAARLDIKDQEYDDAGLKQALGSGSSSSITDDDLI